MQRASCARTSQKPSSHLARQIAATKSVWTTSQTMCPAARGRSGRNSVVRAHPDICQCSADKLNQSWPTTSPFLVESGQMLDNIGRYMANIGQFGPKAASFGALGQISLPNEMHCACGVGNQNSIGQKSPKVGVIPAPGGTFQQRLDNLAQLLDNFGSRPDRDGELPWTGHHLFGNLGVIACSPPLQASTGPPT